MQADELITLVREELLEPVAGFWTDAELLRSINRGEADFINRVRGLDALSQVSLVAGRANYPLPTNFLSTLAVFYQDTTATPEKWSRLTPTTLHRLGQENSNFLTGDADSWSSPSEYFIFNRELWVTPTPAETGGIVRIFMRRRAIPLTSVTSPLNVPDELSDAIRAYVLWKAFRKAKEEQDAQEQKQQYFEFIGQGRRWVKRQAGDMAHKIDLPTNQPWSDPTSDLSE